MKVIVSCRLTLKISCENHLNLSSYECLTQFYLTSQYVNWMIGNLKFICSPFEVCIKISKSSQPWTTGLEEICLCFQDVNLGLWLLRMTLLHAIKVQAGVVKMLAQLFHWDTFLFLRILFFRPMLNSNFSTNFSSLLNILRSPSIS